ncbi:unnamed protein product [Acanthoscelides obtectus]|uniref:Transposase n=1 Tax=Acanthoscelides obtectus TaxID=200917 RepID=A0A9P0Q0C1_ACAOB|nr:unnamed protein product [Acanthoscelides obtectus]CAK1675160.1 Mariner Mos1 transposase [Acanthoscelides obtectus]
MDLNREHFRAIIYYNFHRQLSQQECLAELLSVFGNEAPHQSTISRWYGEFKPGGVSLSDHSSVGAPKMAVTQENVDAVRKLIIEDRHVTYLEIEAKLVSRWMPHLLTEEQKAARVNWCQKMLDRFNSGNSKNVYSIVSDEESWIYCYEPENKRQSAVWVFQGEEKPTKVIRSRSVSKKMPIVSKAGHIATIPLNEQRTVTADWYTTICLPKVITELRKINPERRIILHQDNASSHTAQKTRQYLTKENVEFLDRPPYSPDLCPNDFFTFPKIKNRLREEAVDAFKNASYSIEDRIKVIQEHYKNGAKIKNTFRALREHFGRNNRPNETTIAIGRLVRKFEATGSVANVPGSGRPRSVRTPENIAVVKESVRDDPKQSTTRRSQELGISSTSLLRILHKDLNVHAYKIQLTQELHGATCHTTNVNIHRWQSFFGDRVISRRGNVPWPPRSCDLTRLDFFLWGYLKSKVYVNKPATLQELKNNIIAEINAIEPTMLQNVIENFDHRVDVCKSSRGEHLSDIIFHT